MQPIVTRRAFLAAACASVLGAHTGISGASTAAAQKPNIIFILADDLGYGDLGCYGQKEIQTPHLDALAKDGMRFTQCYAGSSVCAPSRCCLMTGYHNGHGRLRDNIPDGIWLQPDDVTIAEVLKQAGYRTGGIGKWSLGNPGSWGVPNYQGFDYYFGNLDQDQAQAYYPDYVWENEQVINIKGNRGGKREVYNQDLFTEKALGFIEENRQRPFFLYLPYTLPHRSEFDKDTPESLITPSDAPYTDRAWPQVEKNYAAMVTRLDADVGRIMEHLKKLGIDDNTLVMFSSDNGPSAEALHAPDFFDSNGPMRGVKRELYEGSIRVPMIARWPERIPAGRVSDQIMAFWDVFPTLAELAGLPARTGIDGISMAPTLLGTEQREQHEYLYWDYGHTRGTFAQAVRAGKWKGIRTGQGVPLQVFDLDADLGETTDVAVQHPEVVATLERYLAEAYVASPDYPIAQAKTASP